MYIDKVIAIMNEVKKVVSGKDDCVEKVMMAMLANGHILIEDIPGVGKTTMALAFSKACDLKQNRVQFTPDVLPADITGFTIYQKETGTFAYQPGAVMCNLFLADEINRTSPKTQSALLEVMEEGTVTVDSKTREVPVPFLVMATQNPIGSAGTQMLPESQLDRFMICMSMGYPDLENEIAIMKERYDGNPIERVTPVIKAEELLLMQKETEQIYIHDTIYNYIAELITATRKNDLLELGISPRGGIAMTRMARACAYISGREYVMPADVEAVFYSVANHRIKLSAKARVTRVTAESVMESVVESAHRPSPMRE